MKCQTQLSGKKKKRKCRQLLSAKLAHGVLWMKCQMGLHTHCGSVRIKRTWLNILVWTRVTACDFNT